MTEYVLIALAALMAGAALIGAVWNTVQIERNLVWKDGCLDCLRDKRIVNDRLSMLEAGLRELGEQMPDAENERVRLEAERLINEGINNIMNYGVEKIPKLNTEGLRHE